MNMEISESCKKYGDDYYGRSDEESGGEASGMTFKEICRNLREEEDVDESSSEDEERTNTYVGEGEIDFDRDENIDADSVDSDLLDELFEEEIGDVYDNIDIENDAPNRSTRSQWVYEKPDTALRKRGCENIVRERPGPGGIARNASTEKDTFLLFFDENMLATIVRRTNQTMVRNRKGRTDATFDDTDVVELKSLLGLLLFRGLLHDTQQTCADLWYADMFGRPIYCACMSYKRYQFLMMNITFHDSETIRRDFLEDRFAKMRWLVDNFERNARHHYQHTEFLCIDETLRNYYGTYHCDFKVYLPDKPGKYNLLFRCLADATDRYVSRVIPYVTPAASNKNQKTLSMIS